MSRPREERAGTGQPVEVIANGEVYYSDRDQLMIRRAARPDTHFTILRNDVLRDNRLSYRARGVLVAILSRPDNWTIRADQLALHGNEGRGAIRTALNELRDCGYLKTFVRKNSQGHFITEQVVFDTPQCDENVNEPSYGNLTSEDRTSENRNSDSWTPLEETSRRNEKKKPTEGVNNSPATFVADNRFDDFWAVYPKRRDKEDARRAWVKALKKSDAETLISRATAYAKAREGKDPQFTKLPATWLNKGSWLDESDPEFVAVSTGREAVVDRVKQAQLDVKRARMLELEA